MKKSILKSSCLALAITAMTVQASALSYTYEGVNPGLMAQPTSVTMTIPAANSAVDLSKDTAVAPPFFGSGESYLPDRSEGLTVGNGSSSAGSGYTPDGGYTGTYPGSTYYPGSVDGDRNYVSTRFTALTDEDYYSDGRIGRLSIPALDVYEKIYEGTSNTNMAKGVAHFSSTSIWNGNVALAGHNRGSNDVFKSIHKLETGDKITLTTKNGTRTYSVYSVSKVLESDTSCLDATYDNILTLVTCVRNQSEYRYVVRAREV